MASCRMHQQCDRQVRTLPTLWCCAWRLIAGASSRARSRACTSAMGVGSARIMMSSGSTCGPANPNQANAAAAGARMLNAEVSPWAHVALCCSIDATWSRTATRQTAIGARRLGLLIRLPRNAGRLRRCDGPRARRRRRWTPPAARPPPPPRSPCRTPPSGWHSGRSGRAPAHEQHADSERLADLRCQGHAAVTTGQPCGQQKCSAGTSLHPIGIWLNISGLLLDWNDGRLPAHCARPASAPRPAS